MSRIAKTKTAREVRAETRDKSIHTARKLFKSETKTASDKVAKLRGEIAVLKATMTDAEAKRDDSIAAAWATFSRVMDADPRESDSDTSADVPAVLESVEPK